MRILIPVVLVAALAGCTVVPRDAWTFDPTRPVPKATLPMDEVVALTGRTAQLQSDRNDVRARIAAETDVRSRLRLYSDLHRVGSDLSPLERRLASVAASR